MQNLKRLCAGGVLMLAFALPAFAGQIPCGVTDPPPPPPSAAQDATTPATDDAGVLGVALSLLQGLLSVL